MESTLPVLKIIIGLGIQCTEVYKDEVNFECSILILSIHNVKAITNNPLKI